MRGKLTTALLLAWLLAVATAADAKTKKDKADADTVKVAFFNGFTVRLDLVGAYQMLFTDHGQWEAGARINLKGRYFPAVEAGWGAANHTDEYNNRLTYKARAPYFRVGCDFNVLKNKRDVYRALVGVRYGFSIFNYDRCIAHTEPVPEGEEGEPTITYIQYEGLNATYHWIDVVLGVEARIWGPLILGWDVRYRRHIAHKQAVEAEPWYIPGFGGQKTAGISVNFNLTLGF